MPNFNLINQKSLDKILKAEVFVHSDGQLRAAHLILGYTTISKNYQAPKCIIKAEGTFTTNPIPEGIPKVALPPQYKVEKATSSHPATTKEEEEEIVEVSDSEDKFDVFNQPLSSKASTGDLRLPFPSQSSHHRGFIFMLDDMGIQRKQRSTLQELLESQPGRDAPEKVA